MLTAAALLSPAAVLFAAPSLLAASGGRQPRPMVGISFGSEPVGNSNMAAAASLTLNPLQWGSQASPDQSMSPREWVRMFRILGISEDSSRDQVMRATARLRRKYAEDEESLDRVERANLWIMTRIVSRNEEIAKQRQRTARFREVGNTPKRLFMNLIGQYLPAGVRDMIEMPDSGEFKRSSGLLGVFALMGLCVPTQATNFVGLGAAACMGLIYARGRPVPVKDEMGNAGSVQGLNYRECGGAVAVVVASALMGAGVTLGLGYVLVDSPMSVIFCTSCCIFFWMSSLFFKVYGCFDQVEP